MISDIAMLDLCVCCHHRRENHMPDVHNGRTDCDFPDCDCHGFIHNS